MKKVMMMSLVFSTIMWHTALAQEKTMPMDSMRRDNMRTPTDNMPIKTSDMPMDNMPMKTDSTPPNMPMKTTTTPNLRDTTPDKAYNRKMEQTVNRMNRDSMVGGNSGDKMRQDTALKGMYNGQKIRSDTIRKGAYYNGMRMEDMPKDKVKLKNRKELDGTQNGKYNYETSRDSMPDAKNIDPYRKRYGSKYGDKMARNSTGMTEEKMRAQMEKENRGVLMHRGRTMIVKNGQKTFIKSHTYLSYGTKVMSDGTIIKKDGTKTMMQQGEFVNMMGDIVPMKE